MMQLKESIHSCPGGLSHTHSAILDLSAPSFRLLSSQLSGGPFELNESEMSNNNLNSIPAKQGQDEDGERISPKIQTSQSFLIRNPCFWRHHSIHSIPSPSFWSIHPVIPSHKIIRMMIPASFLHPLFPSPSSCRYHDGMIIIIIIHCIAIRSSIQIFFLFTQTKSFLSLSLSLSHSI